MLDKKFKYISQVEQDEHDDTANVEVKKVGAYGWDANALEWSRLPITDGKLDVNATVNAQIDTTGLATDSNQTDGSQKTQIVDAGGEAVTVTGGKLDVNATASLAGETLPVSGATEGVGVAILDGSGNQITSFGGGTQYTEGDTDASITGTALMLEGDSDTLVAAPGTAADGMLVNLGGNNDVTVTGSVTANAGTNLNTSALALESGGNLATIAGKDFATQTTLAAINAKLVTGTDIGDVTINNGAGAAAVNIQDGGNTITVDGTVGVSGTVAVTQSGTWDEVGINDSGNSITVDQPTGSNLHTVVDSGTITTVSTVTSVTAIANALPAGTNNIGDVDILSIAAGDNNIGNVDVASIAAGTNAIGKLLPPDIDVTTHTNYARKYYTSTGAATDGIIWSPAAGKRWHVVTMYIQTSAAATITLEDDKAGGDDPVWKGELAANSGVVLSFTEKYPMASGEDAADLIITTSAGNVYVTCVGYEV